MDLPIKFPHPADVIAEAVERDRHLTVEQRLDRLGQLYIDGIALESLGSITEGRLRAKEQLKAEWLQAHREVIRRHGK